MNPNPPPNLEDLIARIPRRGLPEDLRQSCLDLTRSAAKPAPARASRRILPSWFSWLWPHPAACDAWLPWLWAPPQEAPPPTVEAGFLSEDWPQRASLSAAGAGWPQPLPVPGFAA